MKKNNFEAREINNLYIKASKEDHQMGLDSHPNFEFFYRGNDIVKLWEQYLKSKDQHIKFYCKDHRDNIETVNSIFNNLTQNKESCLVIKANETLYLNKDKKSISLCGEIDYKGASDNSEDDNNANKISQVIELIKAYNQSSKHEIKITNHLIIFPYHIRELHWNLGVIELELNSDNSNNVDNQNTQITKAQVSLYDPYGGMASCPNLIQRINSLADFNKVKFTQKNFEHKKQQNDSAACGAISAENGKEFLKSIKDKDDSINFLEISYSKGAEDLRKSHIREINNQQFYEAQRDNKAYEARGDQPLVNQNAVIDYLKQIITKPENDWVGQVISNIQTSNNDEVKRNNLDLFRQFLIKNDIKENNLETKSSIKASQQILKPNGEFREGSINLIDDLANIIKPSKQHEEDLIYYNLRNQPEKFETFKEENKIIDNYLRIENQNDIEPLLENILSKRSKIDLSNSKEEKNKTLAEIKTSYERGLEYYRENNLELAEAEFVKVLKPTLSKPTMQSLYVNIEACSMELLDSVYHLGMIYLVSDKYLNHHAKAAAIFQYCDKFSKKYAIKQYEAEGKETDFLKEAYLTEQKFLDSINKVYTTNHKVINEKSKQYLDELTDIRELSTNRLSKIKDWPIEKIKERAKEVENVYNIITKFFVNHDSKGNDEEQKIGLIQQLIKDGFEQIGPVPEGCKYSFISLGSLAGGRMTPWSDLEFAVLINENKEEYKEYFRNLTKLLHIKVINLGETPLRSLGVEGLNNFRTAKEEDDWFWDELTNNGFSFDGPDWHACKNPLGRRGGYKAINKVKLENGVEEKQIVKKPDFELILTPKEMAAFQREQPINQNDKNRDNDDQESWFRSDTYLVQALRLVSLIDGSQALLDDYRKELETVEDYQIIEQRSLEKLKQDVNSFSLKLSNEEEGKLIDVKKDIFRIGDRIIDDLANYYKIIAEKGKVGLTVWSVINEMLAKELLSKEGAEHLREAISIAAELRLATYCHNKGQKESVLTYEPAVEHLTKKQKKQLLEETFYVKDTLILHHFYYVMMAVQTVARLLYGDESNESDKMLFKTSKLFLNNEKYEGLVYEFKGLIHARFLEYDQALEYLERAKKDELKHNTQSFMLLDNLFSLYFKMGLIDKATKVSNEMLEVTLNCPNPDHQTIANCYNNLGNAHFSNGIYIEAIEQYNKALATGGIEALTKFRIYNNLGTAYGSTGFFQKAEYYYLEAITLSKSIGSPVNEAQSYNNIGILYYDTARYAEAMHCYNQALDIKLRIYKHIPNHPDIADSYTNMGVLCGTLGNYDQAINYHNLALNINLKRYFYNSNYFKIAANYNNIGCVYKDKCQYDQAIEYYKKALDIKSKTYSHNLNHPEFAISYNNLGIIYSTLAEYEKAIEFHNLALNIYLNVYKMNTNHPSLAHCFGNLGSVYYAEGNYEQALHNYKKALNIMLEVYQYNLNHPDIASINSNIGITFRAKGQYKQALHYQNIALDITEKAYKSNQNHPNIASSYENLGNSYYKIGEIDKALLYYRKAEKIKLDLYQGNINHSSIANYYTNLGNIYIYQAKYKQAFSNYQKALKINLQIYELNLNHPIIAINYSNLGNVYMAEGRYEDAIKFQEFALDIRKEIYKSNPNHPEIAKSYSSLGSIYLKTNDIKEAIKYHRLALNIRIEAYKNNSINPDIADSYNDLGNVYLSSGQYKKALDYYILALNKITAINAGFSDNVNLAVTYNNIGNTYEKMGNLTTAIDYHQKALNIKKAIYASNINHLDLADSYNNLGNVYLQRKEYELAVKYHKDALNIKLEIYKNNLNHPSLVMSYNNIGALCNEVGAYDQAIKYCHRALDANKDNQITIANIYDCLGNAYLGKGQYKQALHYLNEALNIRIYQGFNYDDVISSYINLGVAYDRDKNYELSITSYKEALNFTNKMPSKNFDLLQTIYTNIGVVYFCMGDYEKSYNNAKKALDVPKDFKYLPNNFKTKILINSSLIQLGNQALINDDVEKARGFYRQANSEYDQIDFFSKKFILIQLEQAELQYKRKFLEAAINCQKILIKIDPTLEFGNHFHNLACFYISQGKLNLANETFIKALSYADKVTGGLHVEYAQFLILNSNNLEIDPSLITNHLYAAINHDVIRLLQYNEIEKDSVCKIIKKIIEEKNNTIYIMPKILAYYLLIKYPKYLALEQTVKDPLVQLKNFCRSSLDEIAYKLLIDAYENYDSNLVIQYLEELKLIEKINCILKNKIKLEDATIDFEKLQALVINLKEDGLLAIYEGNYLEASSLYTNVINIYNKILVNEIESLLEAINIAATILLLDNRIDLFAKLISKGAGIDENIIKLSGQDLKEILEIENAVLGELTQNF